MRRFEDDLFDYFFWLIMFAFSSYWYFTTKSMFFDNSANVFSQVAYYEHLINFVYIGLSLATFLKIVEKIAIHKFYFRKQSFITLIDKDYGEMTKTNKKSRNRMLGYFISLITNVFAGVVASYFYANTLL
ncbi:MAG: hypothetical protein ACSHW0_19275 [Thalassotalea sp.]